MFGVIWFREDLRIHDNKALYFAAQQCSSGVIGVYIIDRSFLSNHDVASCRVAFCLQGLAALSADLAKLNIPLLIFEIEDTRLVTQTLLQVMVENKAQALFFNRQYELDEKRRDLMVSTGLAAKAISCYSYDDSVILPPGSVQTQQGSFFKVFTPFKRAWYQVFSKEIVTKLLPAPKAQVVLPIKSTVVPKSISGFSMNLDMKLWPAGEKTARRRLTVFIKHNLFSYAESRDFPALKGTSQLSPYLAAGMISPRECFLAALKANQEKLDTGNKGAVIWMAELIWREFYKHLLVAVPRISMNKAYQLKTEKFPWRYNQILFSAWMQGKTGIPIIDAAMRQLNAIGWMHNRLRMIVASFLTKNLQLDWRLGEKYFMQHLIDGDLAANNGGWQWSASTGVDAVPYFRVFNPITQGKRFDPEGTFVRQYCPELNKLSASEIHNLTKHSIKNLDYPLPIVDLETSRRDYIAVYKKTVLNGD